MHDSSVKPANGRVLVVEDDVAMRRTIVNILQVHGYLVETAADGFKALAKLATFAPQVMLSDLRLPGMSGVELLQRAQEADSQARIVLITGFASVDNAVATIRQGAFDYLTKPVGAKRLITVIEAAMRDFYFRHANQHHGIEIERLDEGQSSAPSPEMMQLLRALAKVAPTRATVLVTGETGTGKELVARALHQHGLAPNGPFVAVNCAALCESLLESELFGHEAGAFTGASHQRDGKFKQAHGGMLFLDEVAETSPAIQCKLLRVLQERTFERVGSNTTVSVDIRLVAATNRDLRREVACGTFRQDLFYRLNVINMHVPPLRERRGEIPALVAHFVRRFNAMHNKGISGVNDAAMEILSAHAWPGNVRELENAIEHAVIMARHGIVYDVDLPSDLAGCDRDRHLNIPGATLAEVERFAICKTLEHVGGSTGRAAQMLGVSKRKVQYMLREALSADPSALAAADGRDHKALGCKK